MRKVVYSMIVSLDGYVATADGKIGPLEPDEELHRLANDEAREADIFVYGRRLYEVMEAWRTYPTDASSPAYITEFAHIWRQKPKVVVSRTLDRVEHEDVTLVRDHVEEYIARLKQQPGGAISVGGPTLAASLIRRGLVDEYRLMLPPVVLGGGTPFFPARDEILSLRLADTRVFRSGVIYARYEPRRR